MQCKHVVLAVACAAAAVFFFFRFVCWWNMRVCHLAIEYGHKPCTEVGRGTRMDIVLFVLEG